jgi:glycosyltransferase involved in cell wall biosynthesis
MALRVVTSMAVAPFGGAENFFAQLSVALKRAGVDVLAALRASPIHEAMLTAGGVPYRTFAFGRNFDFRTGRELGEMNRQFRPDVVLTFTQRSSSMMPKGDYPIVGRLGGYYNLKYFKRCDYLTCITPDIVQYVVKGGWPEARVFYIPNFPDVHDVPPVDRASLNTPEGAPVALALARLHPNKALDVLLRAAAKVPELYVWLAGEGEERAKLEAKAEAFGLSSRVRFLGWRTDRSALLRAADVCVFPSRWEPNGTVVVEAWAHGVPLVTAAAAGPAWIARDGEDALVVPVDDHEALAGAIKQVIGSKELARRLVENGAKRVAAEFSEPAVVRGYIEMFERVKRRAAA